MSLVGWLALFADRPDDLGSRFTVTEAERGVTGGGQVRSDRAAKCPLRIRKARLRPFEPVDDTPQRLARPLAG